MPVLGVRLVGESGGVGLSACRDVDHDVDDNDCKRDSLRANGLVCAQADDGCPILPRCELLPRVLMAAMDAIVDVDSNFS